VNVKVITPEKGKEKFRKRKWSMSMQQVHFACPFCMPLLHSILHAYTSRPCFLSISPCRMSMLHVPAAFPCFMSKSSWCMSLQHVHAACPCCMNMLHQHAAWTSLVSMNMNMK
jgi:hypothetical protein